MRVSASIGTPRGAVRESGVPSHPPVAVGKADALEIHVDRGDGKGFAFLAIDTVPGYIDTAPIPATPAVWKYKAIYRKNDERIGQWSAVVSVGLGG